jgi:hypothetical protein
MNAPHVFAFPRHTLPWVAASLADPDSGPGGQLPRDDRIIRFLSPFQVHVLLGFSVTKEAVPRRRKRKEIRRDKAEERWEGNEITTTWLLHIT